MRDNDANLRLKYAPNLSLAYFLHKKGVTHE
jgi:hypothetical protein